MLGHHHIQFVQQVVLDNGRTQTLACTGEAVVTAISLLDESGMPLEVVDVGQMVCLKVEVQVKSAIERLVFGYGIKDRVGQVIYGTNTALKKDRKSVV